MSSLYYEIGNSNINNNRTSNMNNNRISEILYTDNLHVLSYISYAY